MVRDLTGGVAGWSVAMICHDCRILRPTMKKLSIGRMMKVAAAVTPLLACLLLVGYLYWLKPYIEMRVCLVNQRQMDGAAEIYAMGHSVSVDWHVPMEEIVFTLKDFQGMMPWCPSGGTYKPWRFCAPPACSVHGSLLSQKQFGTGSSAFDVWVWKHWLANTITNEERELGGCMRHCHYLIYPYSGPGKEEQPPPYEKDVPGYLVMARHCAKKHLLNVNCPHGAPGSDVGGWQMVNLSRGQWHKLIDDWYQAWNTPGALREGQILPGVPILWCGHSTGTGRRVVVCIRNGKGGQEWVTHEVLVTDADLARNLTVLNGLLKTAGESPVTLNAPDNVNWTDSLNWKNTTDGSHDN